MGDIRKAVATESRVMSTTAAELDLDLDAETERVLLWREEELERVGYGRETARHLVGKMAAQYSQEPGSSGSVAMRRIGEGGTYQIETFLTPLSTVAKETKHMDASFIASGGNNITQAFIDYASPLIGKLPEVGTFDEM